MAEHVGEPPAPAPATPATHRVLSVLVQIAGWIAVTAMALLLLTQFTRWHGPRWLTALHALTPYLLAPSIPVAVAASALNRHRLALTSAAVAVGLLVLSFPLVVPPGQPHVAAGGPTVSVVHANLRYGNNHIEAAAKAIDAMHPDIISFSEYTPRHARRLAATDLAGHYRYRIEHVAAGAGGTALWSKYPVEDSPPPISVNRSINAVVSVGDVDLRIVVVHPPTPVFSVDEWRDDLRLVGQLASQGTLPLVVIGDMNSSYWHPEFRALLDDADLRDAHQALGHGWSPTWPSNKAVPPFVQIDHALLNDRVAAREAGNFDLPGSDHRGIAVTLAVAAPPAAP